VPHPLVLLALSVEGSCEGSFLGMGFLNLAFLISGVPTVIPSEQTSVPAHADSRIGARDLLLATLESTASERDG